MRRLIRKRLRASQSCIGHHSKEGLKKFKLDALGPKVLKRFVRAYRRAAL